MLADLGEFDGDTNYTFTTFVRAVKSESSLHGLTSEYVSGLQKPHVCVSPSRECLC